MIAASRSDELRIGMAITARFYHSGLDWAASQSLPDLLRWNKLMRRVWEEEHGR